MFTVPRVVGVLSMKVARLDLLNRKLVPTPLVTVGVVCICV